MVEAGYQTFEPDWFSKPADSLLGLLQRRSIPIEELADALEGGIETIRGLLHGTRAIDSGLAITLSRVVGGAPSYWLKRQDDYDRLLDLAVNKAISDVDEWLSRAPIPGHLPRGKLSQSQKILQIRKKLSFYGVNSLQSWHRKYSYLRDNTQFRTSQAYSSKESALSLWLRLGELEASLTTTNRWNPVKLRESIDSLVKLSKIRHPHLFMPKLKRMCAEAGVAIVAIRAPKGCTASGASRLISSDKAMILLSFRHLSDDHFWFTLMHEFGHLLLHGAESFVDTDDTDEDEREREANEFASGCIVPASRWEEFISLWDNQESILRFSISLGVAPGLIVGQLQHRNQIPQNRLNHLKRRWSWDEIDIRTFIP